MITTILDSESNTSSQSNQVKQSSLSSQSNQSSQVVNQLDNQDNLDNLDNLSINDFDIEIDLRIPKVSNTLLAKVVNYTNPCDSIYN